MTRGGCRSEGRLQQWWDFYHENRLVHRDEVHLKAFLLGMQKQPYGNDEGDGAHSYFCTSDYDFVMFVFNHHLLLERMLVTQRDGTFHQIPGDDDLP